MIEVGDDPLAGDAAHRADDRHAARRYAEHLTGKFTPVGQHVAAKQVHGQALEAALFLVRGKTLSIFCSTDMTRHFRRISTGGARACVVVVKALLVGGFERGRPRAP